MSAHQEALNLENTHTHTVSSAVLVSPVTHEPACSDSNLSLNPLIQLRRLSSLKQLTFSKLGCLLCPKNDMDNQSDIRKKRWLTSECRSTGSKQEAVDWNFLFPPPS